MEFKISFQKMEISDIELLQTAVMNGIIDIDDVRIKLIMENEKKILENHPYAIWQRENAELVYIFKGYHKKVKKKTFTSKFRGKK